jgi:PAS domain S-box-containing protein
LTAIRGAEGELRGFAKITQDLTAQKAAEDAMYIRNSQLGRYRMIVESVADYVIFTLDAEGRIDSWSAGARSVLGYRSEEAIGREYALVFTPEDIEAGKPQQEIDEATRNGHCTTEDWRSRRDGTRIWVSGALTAVRDDAGKLTGFIRVARDMTAQKLAEEAMHELNRQLQRYRIIVENVTDHLVYTLDAQGRIDSWGPSAQVLAGRRPEEAIGRDYSISYLPAEQEAGKPQQDLEEAARNGYCATEGWRMRGDGSITWSSGVLTAVRDETGKLTGFVRVARDMTAQKRLEESLVKSSAELEIRVAERTRELRWRPLFILSPTICARLW